LKIPGDSLGLLETSSIASGVRATDEVLKTAGVHLVEACPISPGKFLVIFAGPVADVEASLEAGRAIAAETVVDELFLARVHPEVAPAIGRQEEVGDLGVSLGVVETLSVASAIVGADAAAKTARVSLLEIGAGRGIGGKGFFTMSGAVADVESAAEAARALIDRRGYHLRTEIMAAPHSTLASRVARMLQRPWEGDEE
jgi:microcompartment protein CcmL/EutN